MAAATPPSPDQAPIVRARSSGSNEAWISASDPGVSSAPPMPCSTRAAMRNPAVGATAHSSDAVANHATPTRNTRRRPYRSPSAPPSRISAARASVYPVTVHCRPESPVCRSRPIRGNAMLTTVASSDARLDPSTVASSAQRPAAEDRRRPMARP